MDLKISLSAVKNKRILLSPLNWGLGHVMRCIPLIDKLLENENEVIICCDQQQEDAFRDFFPELWYVPHSGYPFAFKGNGNWEADLIRSFRKLNSRLKEEVIEVERFVSIFKPDYIISDQRYGFRSAKVQSIFITHQLNLPVSGIFTTAQWINRFLIKKFNSVFVYDSLSAPLAGRLSAGSKEYTRLGVLSRFKPGKQQNYKFKFTAIVSGPKPYSELFFDEVKEKFKSLSVPCVIISNTEQAKASFRTLKNCTVLVNPSFEEMQNVLQETDYILSRAGYTTLMDLTVLDKKALLVPTKGQKEQLYLTAYHKNHPKWTFVSEDDFIALNLSEFEGK
ncbi:MAG: glycosyltransferase [Lishizhenia sp.]